MAGIGFSLSSGEVPTGTAAKTILQLTAAANHAVMVKGWGVSFQGVTNNADPILCQLIRQTSAGTGGSSVTLQKINPDDSETLEASGQKGPSGIWTAEPSDASAVLDEVLVHPQAGREVYFPLTDPIKVPGSGRLGIKVTAGASVDCVATMKCEE